MSLVPTEENQISVRHQQAMQCRERISRAMQGATVAFLDMSMGLLEAYENEYAKEWGFENFSDYVERELDMKCRSAYYLVEIAKAVRALGIDSERVQRIGWTKMKEITSALTASPDESEKYLHMAETMSTKELKEAIKSEVKMTDAKDAQPVTMRLSLKFDGDTATMVSDALNMAFGDIGKEDVNQGLSYIVGEWMMARGGGVQSSTLEQWTGFIEKQFGVKLVRAEKDEDIDAILVENLAAEETEVSVGLDEDDALDELLK